MKATCVVALIVIPLAFPRLAWAQFKAAALSPDAKSLAAGGAGGKVVLWDVESGRSLGGFKADRPVQALAYVNDDKTLAVGMDQGGLDIWRRGDGGFTRSRHLGGDDIVYGVAVSPNGKTLAYSALSGWTNFHDTKSWERTGRAFERGNLTSGLSFSKDGSFLATAGNGFVLWDLRPTSAVWGVPDGLTVEQLDQRMKGAVRFKLPWDFGDESQTYCADVAVSPDGKHIVGVNGTTRLDEGGGRLMAWETATGKPAWTRKASLLVTVIYTADGARIVTGSNDGVIRLWNALDGKLLREIKTHGRKAVRSLAALPGSNFISAAEDETAALWAGKMREYRATQKP